MSYKLKVYFYDYNTSRVVDATGCKVIVNGVQYSGGQEVQLSASTLSVEYLLVASSGYDTFYQWQYSTTGGYNTSSSSNQTISITPTDQCYVIIWCKVKGASYQITYDSNYPDGTHDSSTATTTFGKQLQLQSSKSYSGYDFVGWKIGSIVYAPSAYIDVPANDVSATGQWQPSVNEKYTVYYYYNNTNKGTTTSSSTKKGTYLRLNSSPGSYTGMTFVGWEIEGVVYPPYGSYLIPDRDVKANGVWKPNDIVLYFGTNGGVPMLEPMTVQYGVEFTLPSTTPSKAKCTFYSWSFNSSYYTAGEKVTLLSTSSSYTPYAQFQSSSTTNQQTVTYSVSSSYGEITGVPSSPSYESWTTTTAKVKRDRLSTYSNPPYVTAKSGYVFAGWYEGSSLTYRKILPTSKIGTTSSSPYVYAVFYLQQTLRFSTNGGQWEEGGKSTKELIFSYGDKYSGFPVAVRTGYLASRGWFTESQDAGIEFVEGTTCTYASTSTESKYLYARWGQVVTFNARGGTSEEASREFTIGDRYSNLPNATWEGHDFLGWFDGTYDSSLQISDKNIVTRNNARTIYARWKENNFIAKFHRGSGYFKDGSGDEMKQMEFEIGSYFSNFPPIGRTGFSDSDFIGWFDANGTQYKEGDICQSFAIVDLYPKWNGYKIQYYAMPNSVCKFDDYSGQSVTLDYPPNTAIGSTPTVFRTDADRQWFDGWYENETYIDSEKIDASYVITKSNVYAYSRWAQKVTFNANGGTFSGGEDTYIGFYFYGYNQDGSRKTFGEFPTPPTKGELSFKGWFTEQNGGTQITTDSQVEAYTEKTYYAHWNVISVKFKAYPSNVCSFEDGTTEKTIQFREGEPYGTLPTVVRTDGGANPFMGWYSTGYPEIHIKEDTIATSDVYDVESKWELKVTFKANGGIFGGGGEEVVRYYKYGKDDEGNYYKYGEFPAAPTRENYEFIGWYYGSYFNPENPEYNKADVTDNVNSWEDEIYAQWRYVGLITLTFDPDGGSFQDGSTQPIVLQGHAGDSFVVPDAVFDYPAAKIPWAQECWYADDYSESRLYLIAKDSEIYLNSQAPAKRYIPEWKRGYTYMFYDDDGTYLGRYNYFYTVDAYPPTYTGQGGSFVRTDKPGLQFKEWNPNVPNYGEVITSHQKFTAVYEPREVTITFVGWDGNVLKKETVAGGQTVVAPTPPARANYTFSGWDPPDFSPAVQTMDVKAVYTGRPCAIRFISQGQVIYNTTAEYGGYVTDFPPNPTYEDERAAFRRDEPEPTPVKPKKVFKRWIGADEIVTGDKDLVAEFQTTSGTADRDFGGDVSDYLFVKPSDDFKNNSPKGDPMPKRMARGDGTGKQLRWEDPILLNEWVKELKFLSDYIYNNNPEPPSPTDVPHSQTRKFDLQNLVYNVYDETTYLSGGQDDSIASELFRTIDRTSERAAKGNQGTFYDFYKCNNLSLMPEAKLSKGYNRSYVSYAKLCFGFGEESGDSVVDKQNTLCTTGVKSSTVGGYYVKYCLPWRNHTSSSYRWGEKPPPISKNIPLTLYAVLQDLAGSVVMESISTSEITDSEYDKSEWDAKEVTVKIDETGEGEHKTDVSPHISGGRSFEWKDPELEEIHTPPSLLDDEGWSKLENNVEAVPDTESTRKPYQKLTRPDGSVSQGIGTMGVGDSAVTPTKTEEEETYPSPLAKLEVDEEATSYWKSFQQHYEDSYYLKWDGNDEYGEYNYWYIYGVENARTKYMTYVSSRRYEVSGNYKKTKSFKFKMGSSIIRNHTADGSSGSHGTFLNQVGFFALIQLSVGYNEIKASTNNGSESYPLVPDIGTDEKVIEYDTTKPYVLVPLTATLSGFDSDSRKCIWECSDIGSVIDTALEKFGIKEQWDMYAKNQGPSTARGHFMKDTQIPEDGKVRDSTTDRYKCNGNCKSSANLTVKLYIQRIFGAFIWTPWASVNLPSFPPSD